MEKVKGVLGRAKDCWVVVKLGVLSRLILLLFQVISHNVIPDHIGSMDDVFMKLHRTPDHPFLVERLLGGLDNWDAEYFIFNAHQGYDKHEQTMAFFPLFPLVMQFLSKTILYPLSFLLPQRSLFLICGVLINFAVFPLAAVSLYILTYEISNNRKVALLSSALLCLNPANVFMSAVYSETLFSFFTFSGLLALQWNKLWTAAVIFALATATRSNGVVLSGFLGYRCLLSVSKILFYHQGYWKMDKLRRIVKHLFVTGLQCVVVVAPFCGFQLYGYVLYCKGTSRIQALSHPVWCNWSVPIPYSYIQDHYWNVGFLHYFRLKQLPNFILAVPIATLTCFSLGRYYFRNACPDSIKSDHKTGRERVASSSSSLSWSYYQLRPYVFHLAFLFLFGVFNTHIQILTRFICSSSPLIYWMSSVHLLETLSRLGVAGVLEPKHFSLREMTQKTFKALFSAETTSSSSLCLSVLISRTIIMYFLVYNVLGLILHCNFYPWT